ncbi:MAG: hypothetical protein OEY64_04050 [Nitrospinota bacterium]|nr:hypothetical protein [Nitrospinota bacterium]
MNPAHVHLALNHIPVIGSLLGIGILAYAFYAKSEELKKFSFTFFVAITLLSFPAFFSGEAAEEKIEKMAGVEEKYIEEHEEAAEAAFIAVLILGALAGAGLFNQKNSGKLPAWSMNGVIAMSIITLLLMGRASSLGGEIRHPEIRSGGSAMSGQSMEHEGHESGEHQH